MADPLPELDEEARAWLDADLTPPLEPEDWSGVPRGTPIVWDSEAGAFIVEGGKGTLPDLLPEK